MTIARITLILAAALLAQAQVPPSEYDHDYDGELTILRTTPATVLDACFSVIDHNRSSPLGCAQIKSTNPKKCTIWIVTDDKLRGFDYSLILRHELAHCNGWRHDKNGKTIIPLTIERKLEEWCDNDPYLLMCNEKR